MSLLLKSCFVFAVFTLLMISAAFAGGSRHGNCNAVVDGEITRLNIDRTDITSIELDRRTQSTQGDEVVVGYNAWVRLNSCKGALIVALDKSCRVRQVYTRSECRIDGVKHF